MSLLVEQKRKLWVIRRPEDQRPSAEAHDWAPRQAAPKGVDEAIVIQYGVAGEGNPCASALAPIEPAPEAKEPPSSKDSSSAGRHGESPDVYRYDWNLALASPHGSSFDWMKTLAKSPAIKAQLIFDFPSDKNGTEPSRTVFTEVAAGLIALHPSRNSASVWDCMLAALKEGSKGLGSSRTESIIKGAVALGVPVINSLIPSPGNWWIYRFLDAESGSLAVEWNITKTVLDEYGPALHGVLVVSFHGPAATGAKLRFRPAIRFDTQQNDPIAATRPDDCDATIKINVAETAPAA
ncbi:MAG: hypothetical protein WC526_00735 [Patescibacteria group bacterium]